LSGRSAWNRRSLLDVAICLVNPRAGVGHHAPAPEPTRRSAAIGCRAGRGGVMKDVEVTPEHAGTRLDAFLAAVLTDRSRSQIQQLIKDGHVSGGATQLRPSTPVKAGQRFQIELPDPVTATAEAEDLPLTILYEDHDVVVIDKPAGMVVHPS